MHGVLKVEKATFRKVIANNAISGFVRSALKDITGCHHLDRIPSTLLGTVGTKVFFGVILLCYIRFEM